MHTWYLQGTWSIFTGRCGYLLTVHGWHHPHGRMKLHWPLNLFPTFYLVLTHGSGNRENACKCMSLTFAIGCRWCWRPQPMGACNSPLNHSKCICGGKTFHFHATWLSSLSTWKLPCRHNRSTRQMNATGIKRNNSRTVLHPLCKNTQP